MSVTEVGQEKQPTTGPLSCVGKQETGVQSRFHVAPSVSFALAHSFFPAPSDQPEPPRFSIHLLFASLQTAKIWSEFQPFPCSPPFLLLPRWASLPDQTGDGSIIKMLRVLLKISRGWMHVYSSPTLSSLS